jgi:predicted metal-dependent hydrolase
VSAHVRPSLCRICVLTLQLADRLLEVQLLRRVRKSIGIRIVAGRVELVAHPRVPLAELQHLLVQKQAWIERHLQRQVSALAAQHAPLSQLLLAGTSLAIEHQAGHCAGVTLCDDRVVVGGAVERLRPQLTVFLQHQAELRLPPHFQALAPMAARPPQRLQISKARTRWGSCNQQGVIRLNWRLVQAPVEVLDYVIAHELAHLRHMNHGAAFWQETARLYPDWKSARAWLKRHGESLFVFG